MHKISSNIKEVVEHFPETERSESSTVKEIGTTTTQMVLGMVWDTDSDELFIRVSLPVKPFTIRGLLSIIGSMYDPLGLIGPITLQGRSIQREIMMSAEHSDSARERYDDPLPSKHHKKWKDWTESLSSFDRIRIGRSYMPSNFGSIVRAELHIFADASNTGISAVAYLRLIDENQRISVSYLMSKSKLIPRAAVTIPRAELSAAVEASFLCTEVIRELNLKIDSRSLYTDSMVVLGFLKNKSKKFSNYITRRVLTILKHTEIDEWSYISTSLNPADIGSRCHTVESLTDTCWLQGPHFLQFGNVLNFDKELHEVPLPEQEKSIIVMKTKQEEPSTVKLILTRVSSFNRVIGVIKLIFSFIHRHVDRVKQRFGTSLASRSPEVTRDFALQIVLVQVQAECYPSLISALMRGGNISNESQSGLCPFIDAWGLLRVGGRLSSSHLHPSQKHPILLPKNHALTLLICMYYHERVAHQGRYLTSGAIREAGYHIEKGSKFIRRLIDSCLVCKRLRAPTSVQLMSDLPLSRVEETPPFHHTGIDVFGPFFVTDGQTTRRTSSNKKTWAALFVCMVSRAVHVEPLPGLDTCSIRNAIRRFSSIRGVVRHFYSDMGTNFVGSENQNSISLSKLSDDRNLREYEWHFNTPHASHHGGSWERKIGAIRRILEASLLPLAGRVLTRDELSTFLCESSSIVNNTPLYNVSVDPNDPMPVTPSMLINLKDSPNPAPLDDFSEGDILAYGQRRWRRVQYLSECFWSQWRKHYLSSLMERKRWNRKRRNLEIGDVVLVKEKQSERNRWPYGIVTATKPSKDGLVRSVTLDVVTRSGDDIVKKSYNRPITELVLICPGNEPWS